MRGAISSSIYQVMCRLGYKEEYAWKLAANWAAERKAAQKEVAGALQKAQLTMEDVMAQTAVTYPETYVLTMTGAQIKDVLEDVCDNLFNADPYYQQGGDMVRVGGLSYTCAPAESAGKRISELKLDNGRRLEAGRNYKVAGWASVNAQNGAPVWDLVAKYLRAGKPPNRQPTGVTLKGVEDNPGIARPG